MGLLAGLEWFDPFYFCYDDNATQHGPWLVHNYRTLTQYGEFAWMNFHQLLGHPHYLAGQSAVFYFPNYFCGWVASQWLGLLPAITEVTSCLHLMAGLVAMYAWLRVLKVSAVTSVYGALLYITSPFILIVSKSEVVASYCAFYFPVLLACLEMFLVSGAVRYLVLSALLKGLFIYQGNIQFYFLYQVVEMLYGTFRWTVVKRERVGGWRALVSYLISNVVAGVMALPLLMPMRWAMQQARFRTVYSAGDALAWALDAGDWLKAQFFWFEPERVFSSGSEIFYLGGMLVLPWILWRLYRARKVIRDTRWIALLMVVQVTFFLSTTGNLVLSVVPLLNYMRWPYKWYQPVVMGYAVLCALALHLLVSRRLLAARWLHLFFLLAIGSNVLVVLTPSAQKTFSEYHLTPALAREVESGPKLTSGRTLSYVPKAVESAAQRVEQRGFNFPTLFGEQGFAGYDGMVNRATAQRVFFMIYGSALLPAPLTLEKMASLNEWSVRYLITINHSASASALESMPGIKFAETTPSGLAVFENTAARPLAWMESDGQAVPIRFMGNAVTVEMRGLSGHLILSLVRLPGWSFRLDDGPWLAITDETNLGQMRLTVPPQARVVTARYAPPMLWESMLSGFLLLAVLIPLWVWIESQPEASRRKDRG
ncbi:MAG: hypothetical protein B9S32_17095 [Verrucomicrobia bacterium Tous-C9LFEB]|nr:MAG: hypothetical protein B9S32_17095 [Verrucomicrobia bacterium Tous-C9LFEB]